MLPFGARIYKSSQGGSVFNFSPKKKKKKKAAKQNDRELVLGRAKQMLGAARTQNLRKKPQKMMIKLKQEEKKPEPSIVKLFVQMDNKPGFDVVAELMGQV